MAHKLRSDLFVPVVCLSFQSLYISFAFIFSFHSLILASAVASSVQHYKACYLPDRDALLDVAASFSNSSQRIKPLNWGLQDQDCCHWAGVTCGSPFNSNTATSTSINSSAATSKLQYYRVVGLRLVGMIDVDDNATSSVMPTICRLSALVSLDLSWNALSGPIPTCFSHNLTSLQTLNLSNNALSGSLSPLTNLSLLTHLDLSSNFFPSGPTSVQTSSIIISGNLTYMDFSNNFLSGVLSALKFHSPSSLEYLDLSLNSLFGSVAAFTSLLSDSLRYLDLSFNHQLNISLTPAVFSTTPLLQYLNLDDNELTPGDIRVLEPLQHLEVLSLLMPVPARNLGSLFCKLGSLQIISITGEYGSLAESTGSNGILDELLCEKPASVNVTYLDLSFQGYTGPFPKWIAHLASLQSLNLDGNQLEGSIPQGWQALTQLIYLSLLGESPRASVSLSKKVQNWLFRLPLGWLYLTSMGLTSQDFPCAGFSHLNQTLQFLDLSDNHISPGHSLLHCLQSHNFSLLSSLVLAKNPLAVPLQLQMFPVSIRFLDLSYCQLFGRLSPVATLPLATSIDLSHNSLTGSIPDFRFVIVLDLSHNKLTNVIHSSISNLTAAIEYLDLSHNKLTSIIPSSIWNRTAASPSTWLGLNDNHLHGELDFDQALCTIGVSIANNHLSKVHFRNVSSLLFLDLSNNQLGGTLESLLGDYTVTKNLKVLLLHNNHLKGSIPNSLGTSAPSLTTLDLSNNTLTGAIPRSLEHLHALQSETTVTEVVSYTLESVKNVEFNITDQSLQRGHLDLSCNQLNGTIPDSLGALVGLNDLNLSRNLLLGHIPPSLANLASLESLDLSFNQLEGVIPSELSKLTFLEVFNVSFNPKLSGQIPDGPQFETATSYEGDQNLCGEEINKTCTSEQQVIGQQYDNTQQTSGFKQRFSSFIKGIEEWIAIPGLILGHALGMGITIWALKRLHFYK